MDGRVAHGGGVVLFLQLSDSFFNLVHEFDIERCLA